MPRKLFIGVGVLVGLLLLGVVAVLFLIDANDFRPMLQTKLEQQLHRPASLGQMDLKLFPLAIRISDAVVGQPEGFASQQPFLSAKQVYVAVAFWPLIRKQINLHAIRLESPRIELIRNPDGAWNYEIGGTKPSEGGSAGTFSLDELRVEGGQVAIDDQKSTSPRDVYKNVDVTLTNLGPNRHGSLLGSVRLDTMAAVLKVSADFENTDPFAAKGTATLKSDNNKDPLEITFDIRGGAQITIDSLTAKLGALSSVVSGSIDTQKTPPELQLAVKAPNAPIADLIRVAALYGAKVPQDLKADGLLQADVMVTGTTEKPIFSGKIEATKAQITAKDLAEPVRSSELEIDFTPDSLTTHPFTLETGGTRISAQATITGYSGTAPQISATLQTNGARVEELIRIASAYGVKPAGLTGSGTVNLDMKISAAGKTVRYSGSGSLREVSLASPDLPKTLTVSTANILFSDDRIAFDHLQAGLGSMHVDGAGSLRDFGRPRIQLDVHVDQLNVAELREWGVGGGKQQPLPDSGFFKKVSAAGTVTIGKILYDQIVLSNVKASVNLADGLLKLDPVTALVFGGQESGAITADLGTAAATYSIKAKLSNVDANQLLSSTTSLKNVLTGALSGNADLQFTSKPNEEIARTLNGKLQVQMGQGRLAGVQILNEVASVGRFLGYSKKPEAFTNIVKLTGTLNIQNGLASTNDLFLDMGGGTLSGSGTVGLVDQSLKLRVTTVLGKDFAQSNVPGQIGGLLSTVLANQQGELVVPMLVGGTFAQPKFAPDAEQMANLKLRGLLPTATNPGALTSGIKGLVDSMTGKQRDVKPDETKSGDNVQDSIINLFDQFRKKKDGDKK
ncbi:MAG: AsmA family protein [Acidobacteriia bacterium]|nr:AsmA family protein [Terriglobia bacterium]